MIVKMDNYEAQTAKWLANCFWRSDEEGVI